MKNIDGNWYLVSFLWKCQLQKTIYVAYIQSLKFTSPSRMLPQSFQPFKKGFNLFSFFPLDDYVPSTHFAKWWPTPPAPGCINDPVLLDQARLDFLFFFLSKNHDWTCKYVLLNLIANVRTLHIQLWLHTSIFLSIIQAKGTLTSNKCRTLCDIPEKTITERS